jgi:phosphoesterase RecJ-like protein
VPRPRDEDWDGLVAALRSCPRPLLLAHISPDGDALGSALAVGLALRAAGAEPVVAFGDDPMVVPRALRDLPGLDLLVPHSALPAAPEMAVAFDTSSADRLGLLAPLFARAGVSYAVDHHPSYTGFADHALVDGTAPATAVLVAELIDRLGLPLSRDVAVCIYTGLSTDTGSFRYAGTTPETHELAARLLRTGVPHDDIGRRLWDTARFGYLEVLAEALAEVRLESEAVDGRGLVWAPVRLAALRASGLAMDEVEGLIDVVRKTVEAEVAAVLKEDEDHVWRGSLRSKGAVDVGAVAVRLGGGGHRYAAGFVGSRDLGATLDALRAALVGAPG